MSKGTYCLVIKLDRGRSIRIGARPPARFPGGFYCYVGSAMNGLEKRIGRHMSREKALHWHIDYLLEHARVVDVKSIESKNRVECGLSRDVAGLSDGTPMRGFGSSDCSCGSHLHYFRANPSKRIEDVVRKWKASSGPTGRTGKG
jgi:Uri superfamily endonuclease